SPLVWGTSVNNSTLTPSIHTTNIFDPIVGAPLAGRISDRLVTKWRKRRAGEWVPEDRLRGTLFGAVFLVPVSVLCSGIITHYVGGKVGLALNLICLFLNGLGVRLLRKCFASLLFIFSSVT